MRPAESGAKLHGKRSLKTIEYKAVPETAHAFGRLGQNPGGDGAGLAEAHDPGDILRAGPAPALLAGTVAET